MDKLLDQWEKIKEDKHMQACYDQREHFFLFFLSVYEMMGKDALFLLATLIQIIAAKMDEPILHVTGWVIGRIEIYFPRS